MSPEKFQMIQAFFPFIAVLASLGIGGADRDVGKVDAVEEVRVRQLGRQVERQQVEQRCRAVRVDAEEREACGPQLCLVAFDDLGDRARVVSQKALLHVLPHFALDWILFHDALLRIYRRRWSGR